jgi:transglutaminase-like putative cysteine protease
MRRFGPILLACLLFVPPVVAEQPQGKVVEDVWEAAYLQGARVGFFRTTTREIGEKDNRILRTTAQIDLTIKRYMAVVRFRAETGTEETPEGKVTGIFMNLPDQGNLQMTGTVGEKGLHLKVNGGRLDKVEPWKDEIVGLARQDRYVKDHKLKSGDTFSFLTFEPTITTIVTLRGKVGEEEEVTTMQGKKVKLLRVEVVPDKVEKTDQKPIQLPGTTQWLDKEGSIVRRQMLLEGLGTIVTQRSTREICMAPVETPKVDLADQVSIRLNRTIPNAHDTRTVTFRVTVKGDDDPETVLAQDARQKVKNVKGSSFDLLVKAVRAPEKVADPEAETKADYLKSCYYLNSDDAKVKELAAKAIGEEKDPLKKARRIESWVHDNMRGDNTAGFEPADRVAKKLAGDCRQHALLTAAMCRAAGVPSRTAVGLVYATDAKDKPILAYHMWTEVWAKGQWLAIDATLGQGSIGAAHVKIADHSWAGVTDLSPILPVQRAMGKLSFEVIGVNE